MLETVKKNYTQVQVSDIKIGVRYSAPVFFDDGVNMFLAEGKTAKQYHMNALKKWNIPYLLTFGHVIADEDLTDKFDDTEINGIEELEELEELEEV